MTYSIASVDLWQFTLPGMSKDIFPATGKGIAGINSWSLERRTSVIGWLARTYDQPTEHTWYVYNEQGALYLVMTPSIYTMYTLKYSDGNQI